MHNTAPVPSSLLGGKAQFGGHAWANGSMGTEAYGA